MRFIHFALLAFLVSLGALAIEVVDPREAIPNGPVPSQVETYFRWDPYTKHLLAQNILDAASLYLQYNPGLARWFWISATDPRPVIHGSKVQGKRLGLVGQDTLDWFTLQEGSENLVWKRTTDVQRPWVTRWGVASDNQAARIMTEYESSAWKTLGGTVESTPINQSVNCELKTTAAQVGVGEPLEIELIKKGDVHKVILDGQPVNTQNGNYKWTVNNPTAGLRQVFALVQGPDGVGFCSVKYEVHSPLPQSTLKCAIQAEPTKATAGAFVTLKLQADGPAEEVTLDGKTQKGKQLVRLKSGNQLGFYTVLGSAKGGNETATCWAQFEVVKE